MAKSAAYKKGHRAFHGGWERNHDRIPYAGGSNGWFDWLDGWDDANAAASKERAVPLNDRQERDTDG